MLRELVQQIELQKLAEHDPEAFYAEITKLAFLEELELIEKEAGALREGFKRAVGFITGRGAEPAKKLVPSFKGHTKAIQEAVKPGTTVGPKGVVQTTAWDPMKQQVQRSAHAGHVEGWT